MEVVGPFFFFASWLSINDDPNLLGVESSDVGPYTIPWMPGMARSRSWECSASLKHSPGGRGGGGGPNRGTEKVSCAKSDYNTGNW